VVAPLIKPGCTCWLIPDGRGDLRAVADLRRMNRVRVSVRVLPAKRLHLDGRVLTAAWGQASGVRQRYLLLDDLTDGAVAVPETRLACVRFVGLSSRDLQPLPALPEDFVAFSDGSQANPIASVLPELEPPFRLAAVGPHVCSPGPGQVPAR
jgi:hypothetical protein